ncbi:MAG: HtaA domain-containing protein, partial [Microbacteriaceae bacterium]
SDGEPSRNNVELVRLNLAAASKTVSDTGLIRYVGVPTTSINANAVFGDYPAGTPFDTLSFSIGSNGKASGGGTTRPAEVQSETPWSPPATPPVSSGLDVGNLDGLVSGGSFQASASGFAPNETGIRVVVYSTPIVLSEELVADAQGNASFTGVLPADLSGDHTITFQGSINAGLLVKIGEAPSMVTTAAFQCTIADAQLNWGFKESFRSYISAGASGEWIVDGGAEYNTPEFIWDTSIGSIDPEAKAAEFIFNGSVKFTGHQGALNTTIANPIVRIDGAKGSILLDVSGTTQDGAAIDDKAIVFATFDASTFRMSEEGKPGGLSDIVPVLTEAGAAAFGTYPAGTDFDTFTLSYIAASDCVLAPISEEVTAISGTASADLSWLWYTLGALLLIALASGTAVLVSRKKKLNGDAIEESGN